MNYDELDKLNEHELYTIVYEAKEPAHIVEYALQRLKGNIK